MSTKIYDIIDTENGVKFHVNRMEDNLLIDDINVKPGIKTVKFDFGDIRFIYKSTENPIRRNNNIPCYVVGWG